MLNPKLIDAFKYWRATAPKRSAHLALMHARKDVAESKARYPRTCFAMRGGADWEIARDTVFFCEQPDDYLRRVGFVDEIPNESRMRGKMVDHKGWYLEDDYSDELARGVVFQLPAHKGQCRYLAAIADPFNDGPAIICHIVFNDLRNAALNADSLAEHYAEKERDYQRAWQAGQRYSELGETISETRSNVLEILSTRRDHIRHGDKAPTILRVLECKARELIADISEAREERAKLLRDYGREDAFNEGQG